LQIDLALATGQSVHGVAARFKLDRHNLAKHAREHLSDLRRAELLGGPIAIRELAKRAAEEDESVLTYFAILRTQLFALFLDAKNAGRIGDANMIARRLTDVLQCIGKLTGQLREAGITIHNQMNNITQPVVFGDPEIARFQGLVIRALRDFPAAREAVIEALDHERLLDDGARPRPPLAPAMIQIEASADA
jgi:hypothetical protein